MNNENSFIVFYTISYNDEVKSDIFYQDTNIIKSYSKVITDYPNCIILEIYAIKDNLFNDNEEEFITRNRNFII